MRQTARELAEAIGAWLEGDGAVEIVGIAAPERAGKGDLIYVDAAKHAERAANSAAICVIAVEGVALPGKTVLRSAHPKVRSRRQRSCWSGGLRSRRGFIRPQSLRRLRVSQREWASGRTR